MLRAHAAPHAPCVALPARRALSRASASLASHVRRDAAALAVSLALLCPPSASALTSIALSNLRATTVPCPAGQTTSTIGRPRCLTVTGVFALRSTL
jgi:hypothetical protein